MAIRSKSPRDELNEQPVIVTPSDLLPVDPAQADQDLTLRKVRKRPVDQKLLKASLDQAARTLLNQLERDFPLAEHLTEFAEFDPVENAMRRHPGLARETAEDELRARGF